MREKKIREAVRDRYGKIAQTAGASCCGETSSGCCSPDSGVNVSIGYDQNELESIPQDSNMNLGCGNPTAMGEINKGEVVLDLGSGGGIDCFLAAKQVGPEGQVIGVDMTPEMLERARTIAEKEGYKNVEFRLGEIEHLPVADSSVDVIISNCVINLVPDKKPVMAEMARVLKPGGRLMISDIACHKELPDLLRENLAATVGCIGGTITIDLYQELLEKNGFTDIKILGQGMSELAESWLSTNHADTLLGDLNLSKEEVRESVKQIVSAKITAVKS